MVHIIWVHIWVISNRAELARCYWPRVKFYDDFDIIWNINFPIAISILRITCWITWRRNKSSIINFRDAQNRENCPQATFEYPWPIPNSSPQANTLMTPLKRLLKDPTIKVKNLKSSMKITIISHLLPVGFLVYFSYFEFLNWEQTLEDFLTRTRSD